MQRELRAGRDELHRVAADPELPAGELQVVAGVLQVDQQPQQRVAATSVRTRISTDDPRRLRLPMPEMHDTEATTTTSRRDSSANVECRSRSISSLIAGILFDKGVGVRDVRLGLVVVEVVTKYSTALCGNTP